MADKKRKKGGKGRRVWNRAQALSAHNMALMFNSMEPLSEADQTKITMPAWVTLDKLRTGDMESDGFVTLNEFNCMAWQMASRLLEYGASPDAREIALRVQYETEEASGALLGLGNRFNDRSNFVATAEELRKIQEAIRWCSELLGIMPTGLALGAMRDAADMVNDAINNGAKAGAAA